MAGYGGLWKVVSVEQAAPHCAEEDSPGHCAHNDQKREQDVRAIAAPIFSQCEGRYCVTISGPLFRLTAEMIPTMIPAVRSAAKKITDDLQTTEY